MHTKQELLSSVQAAAYLGVKEPTLVKWRMSGEGPCFVRVGRMIRYRQTDIEAWLASRTFGSNAEARAL